VSLTRTDGGGLVGAVSRVDDVVGMARGSWTRRAPLPVATAEVGVAELNGKVYVVGGTASRDAGTPSAASTLVLCYDPPSDHWDELTPLPFQASHAAVTAMGGLLYVIGGLSGNVHLGPHREAVVYDPASGEWAELPSLPNPRGSMGVAAVDGAIHVFGGHDSSRIETITAPDGYQLQVGVGTVAIHDVYSPGQAAWDAAAPLQGPSRDHMGVAVLNGLVHVFGGRVNDYSDMLERHDVYDPRSDTWTSAAPLPEPRSAGAFTVLQGLAIYAGGECRPGGAIFSPDTDTWTELTPLPEARHAFGGATVGNTAFFAGGALVCGGGASSDLLTFTFT